MALRKTFLRNVFDTLQRQRKWNHITYSVKTREVEKEETIKTEEQEKLQQVENKHGRF